MKAHKASENGGPSSQELAAYVDGLLDGAARQRVEGWLEDHPEERAELAGQRSVLQLCKATRPPEPAEAAWTAVLAGIHSQAAAQRRRPAARLRRLAARLILPLSGAAAVLLVVLLHGPNRSVGQVEPFPVAGHEEVEIISLEGADRHLLAVGTMPLSEPIVLVAPGDATEIQIWPDPGDGMVPTVVAQADGMTMIVGPLSTEGKDD